MANRIRLGINSFLKDKKNGANRKLAGVSKNISSLPNTFSFSIMTTKMKIERMKMVRYVFLF